MLAAPLLLALAAWSAAAGRGETAWVRLDAGLELGTFASPLTSEAGDSLIRIVRVDPRHYSLRLLNASAKNPGEPLTARDWCARHGLVAAINASMYQEDHRTSVSLMKTGTHANNLRLSKDMAVLGFDRRDPGVPEVQIIDRECQDLEKVGKRYGTLIQSIRMVSCRGRNVWRPQPKRASIAAVGTDGEGRVLFIHCRSPFPTHDFITALLELPIDLDRAMYVEGGPEAQVYVRAEGREFEFVGSHETGFLPDDDNPRAWPVPNVIGVVRRGRPLR